MSSRSVSVTNTDASAKNLTGTGNLVTGDGNKIVTSDAKTVKNAFNFAGKAFEFGTQAMSAVDNSNARASMLATTSAPQIQGLMNTPTLSQSLQPTTLTGVLGKWGWAIALAIVAIAVAFMWSKRK